MFSVQRPRRVSGIPGTGKTTLAEHAARWLCAPLFGKDELEATLRRSGISASMNSGWAAYELLTTLARGQLERSHVHAVAGVLGLAIGCWVQV